MNRRALRLSMVAALALASCEGTTFRCDPSPSWSHGPADAGPPPFVPGDFPCTAERCSIRWLAVGARHTCGSTWSSTGDVLCWGANERGQVAPERDERELAPSVVHRTGSASWMVALGAAHTCVRSDDGVTCWGDPRVTGGAPGVLVAREGLRGYLTAGALHTCVADTRFEQLRAVCFGAWDGFDPDSTRDVELDGQLAIAGGLRTCTYEPGAPSVECWGGDAPGGRLVPGPWARAVRAPVVPTNEPIVAVGQAHACAAEASVLRCWGRGADGQLGDGTLADHDEPAPVVGLPPRPVTAVCAGGGGALEVDEDGTLVVAPARGFTCAVVLSGLWCWGANDRGQLGDGTLDDRPTPVRVADLPDHARLACGEAHACVNVLGSVSCWGDNRFGQLGIPSSELDHSPVPIPVPLFPEWLDRDR